ncbi:MAG: class II fructose-1,6-bisphosphate aldolase [Bacilli bacterium]|jgi:fructose-bisphosphate aldolase class II|nr:class II fructose-1,6-bisphosphate aldolase [Bacilli bacterium]MDD3389586.1 class II fructose-1,6-bisphosphate aldolase [Bacilli bacterium]MDD4344753.1 class II fructose-1,6-bisphosphate aldolase [Bacilli bacterium]MDD4520923.1 class II fructose-1,6-bisphosphate aldolase [Bacilli bacterium]MDY0399560.1 class II fructose-1,6-bisphosphate aldolase [Bacilli bacterium]
MPLVSMKEMLIKANKEGYAVGAFNINNLEWTLAVLDTAEALKAPVILGVSSGAAKYMGGFNTVASLVNGLIKDRGYTIPIALHLDHGASFEICKTAIDAGFTSVMIDASKYEVDENIRITKQVVDYARAQDRYISVEAEIGHVGGEEEDIIAETMYARPDECVRIVKEANLDCLAPALGSVHGPYKGEPKLGFKEMKEINDLVGVPLVLHGGSGIPDFQIKEAIARGTAKINVNTECQQAFTAIVREVLKKDEKVYDPRKVVGPGMKGIADVVRAKCEVFGCVGKAA